MSAEVITLLGALLVFLGTAVTALAARSAAKRSSEIDNLKVVAEAYTTAQGINVGIVEDLKGEVQRLKELLSEERTVSDDLRASVRRLEERVSELSHLLAKFGVHLENEGSES